jgi:hypothetical protein
VKYFLALCLSIVLLLTGICGFRYYCSQYFGRADAGVQGAVNHAPTKVLFVGSSHTYLSYDIAAIERGTGDPAYAVAYNGMQLTAMAPVIEYLVSHPVTKPKIIVVETYSSNLAHVPSVSDSRLYFESPPALKNMLVGSYLREHPGLDGYTDTFDLVANRGNELLLTYWLTSHFVGRNTYHGSNRTSTASGVDPARFARFRAHLASEEPNEGQLAALRKIIETGQRWRVQLLFVESPMPKPVSQSVGIQKLKRVFETAAASRQIPYLDGDRVFPNDDPQYFKDDNHLSEAGRQRFTAIVTRFLLAHGAGPSTGGTSTVARR